MDRVCMTGSPHETADVSKGYVTVLRFLKPLHDPRAVKLAREGVGQKEDLLD